MYMYVYGAMLCAVAGRRGALYCCLECAILCASILRPCCEIPQKKQLCVRVEVLDTPYTRHQWFDKDAQQHCRCSIAVSPMK